MTLHPLNVLDAMILVVLAWNIVRGFNKGFVEEVVSILGLVVSVFLAFKFSYKVASFIWDSPSLNLIISVGFLIYSFSFFLFKFLAIYIDRRLSQTVLGILNSILGLLFGVFRGVVLASLLVVVVAFLTPSGYLVKKSYLGGICVPVIDYGVSKLKGKEKEELLKRWKVARTFLLKNWNSWKGLIGGKGR